MNFLVAFSVTAQEIDQEQLLANLRFRIPDLQEAELTIGELEPSPYGDLKQGALTINGQQTVQFLLSEEQMHLILLTAAPIDVSLTPDQIAMEREEQARQETLIAAESHRALSRFAEGKPSRGPADAPITIYEFSDFQCPYCARASSVVEKVLEKYPEDVRFVYLHFPLDIHDWAKRAAIAADCASRQSHEAFWILHDNLFKFQKEVTSESMLEQIGSWLEETTLDLDMWRACASDESAPSNQGVSLDVDISTATAKRFGLTGTPAFFVNGYLLSGAQPLEAFDDLINTIKADF
ncbi:MAG: thioredoxin domain-containing protein [Bacteroidetes bacterium]|nr:thioredoxin domain-containing protein [Bacteroidota bacterium]